MRITCPKCGGKARIYTRQKVTEEFNKLYCTCLNSNECGHRFVMNLSFSHSLTNPESVLDSLVFERLRDLSPQQRKMMMEQMDSLS
ncbi:ogr/Delta-like zinc finger family protein [Pseudomonas aeruginosa]|uniref:ogr/Delta-like zinc finger family protein n=1 Tax=Pseudomonas aeruginosa TaxID=287 RepID=UPI002B25C574|nr:ogr/Delta-like zinc finger family protein [Pseudomonas aeruginosa]WOX95343.1 ogr/Delta-like zinc finger family protein [Pseudomonas aeruginosa]HBN8651925.1 ogr/Delta-like zinc finger family protein [Pseudomonas aeruginosa]HCE0322401.1 ogr/Delta-like zinc finger family protein [Pseudomonas aeruginosa]HCE3951685.1 ogr/Delta-like zinc finger family protein [Pseudomonas aeruginosa]